MAEAKSAETAPAVADPPRISPSLLAAVVEAAYVLETARPR
jgi:hypothetical protein